jgi:hypothetical protein
VLIPLTLTWKLIVVDESAEKAPESLRPFLVAHGFDVVAETPVDRVAILRATRGDCRMILAEALPDGAARYVLPRLAMTMDTRFVVFRGKVYGEQSGWVTMLESWWARTLRRLRVSRPPAMPILVAATRSCAAERLAWREFAGEPDLLGIKPN